MNRSGKYPLMMKEYITGGDDVTYRTLASKYGRSPGSIGRIASKEEWPLKRAAYREKVDGDSIDATAARMAGQISQLQEKYLTATEKSLDAYTRAVDTGVIIPRPTDIATLMSTMKGLFERAGVENPEGESGGIRISESLGRDFIRTIESVARSRLESGRVEEPARPKLVGSG